MRDAVLRGRDLCSSEDPYVQVRAAEPWNQVRDRRGRSAVGAGFCGHEPSDAQRLLDNYFWCSIRSEVPMMFVYFGCSCFIII